MEDNSRRDRSARSDDPEAEGIPGYADDTTDAYDQEDRPRGNDSSTALPADSPRGLDEYGVTAAEAGHREPLEQRLEREEPDLTAAGDPTGDPHLVGRIVAPDRGAYTDTEADEVAFDAGRAGGGPTPEEAALHEVDDDGANDDGANDDGANDDGANGGFSTDEAP